MASDEWTDTPAHELALQLRNKEISPVELTEHYLRRIEALNGQLNAYLTVAGDEAMASARTAESDLMAGEVKGALHGVPISVKDLEMTSGIRSTLGSLIYKDHVPSHDSGVVERVKASGAIILGKTNTPEFGMRGTTENLLGDPCRNPWNTARTSGGSSGGAGAAVAAGLCPLATATDAGGSIRIPSSFCGTYGIKPNLGRVPRFGGLGRPSPNLVAQSGPMTTNVRDAAILLQALAGPDDRDANMIRETPPDYLAALDTGVSGLRIAWSADLGYAGVDPEVATATAEAARIFEELGASVDEPGINMEQPVTRLSRITSANSYAAYGHLLDEQPEKLTNYARGRLGRGKEVTGLEYAQSMRLLEEIRHQVFVLMETYDLLMTPTMAVPAFPIGEYPDNIGGVSVGADWGFNPFNIIFNLTGQPAASIPCGFSSDGMPIGLHIVGRPKDEVTVLAASAAFEKVRPWSHIRPQLN